LSLPLSKNPPELFLGSAEPAIPARSGQPVPGETPSISSLPGPICVVFTLSNAEKALARSLQTRGLPFFFPQIRHIAKNRQRVYKALFPGILFAAACQPAHLGSSPEDGAAPPVARPTAPPKRNDLETRTPEELRQALYPTVYPRCPYLSGEQVVADLPQTFRILRPFNQPLLRKELALLASQTAETRSMHSPLHGSANGLHPPLREGQPVRFVQGTEFEGLEGVVFNPGPKHKSPNSNTGHIRVWINLSFLGRDVPVETDADKLELVLGDYTPRNPANQPTPREPYHISKRKMAS
jgi:hypothetical protein